MYYTAWSDVWFDSASLTIEASEVIGLRLHRLAAWDGAALSEARLMVTEKLAAAAELHWFALTKGLSQTPERQASGAISHLRGKVACNQRRLSQPG